MTLVSFLFAKPIIQIIAGEAYLESVPILQITLLYGLLLPYLKQLGTILNVMNKPHIGFYLMLFIFVFNLAINYIFISDFGIIGAAYGTLISYAVSIIINQQILKKELNVSFVNTFRYYLAAHKELFNKGRQYLKRK
jgi:O-antigen/teichoic acid export membrane protein